MRVDRGHGSATHVTPRRDNGVIIYQGKSHIMLAPDELADVLDAIHTLTGQSAPKRAEMTSRIGNE
jgi:hypothetical protein